ncbi:conserved hypothetical protein [Luminiphilus syltensis NOR5-1B]|uniref:Ureidoglycolate hydrolase n=2 Tax=Luminiphilus TaxID=1341118 RepID=B8KU23_9GAMM|nr:conserved hypothetical protein [Luminiphilus syltensis NOR5-1B]
MMTNTLAVIPATPEALAPFGVFLSTDCGVDPLPITFYGGAVDVRKPGAFRCDSDVDITVCRLQERPLDIEYLERHPGHTQAFIPLGGRPFIAVMAPATPDNELPALEDIKAFRFDGGGGFMMFENVWHEFPFAEEPDTDIIILLSTATTESLQGDTGIEGEAVGADLEKRNFKHRYAAPLSLAP